MSNIAEGFEARTDRRFIDYLGRAKASAGEVRAQLYIALDLKYIDEEQFQIAADICSKASSQCYRLMDYLKNNTRPSNGR